MAAPSPAHAAQSSAGAARSGRVPPGVGEAEVDVSGRALGEGKSENGDGYVDIVVNLGHRFPGPWPKDATGVLHQAAAERDRRAEEERVEDRAVEAFADVRAVAMTSRPGRSSAGWSRARAAARALAPMPPSSTTGSRPCSRNTAVNRSTCRVHCVSTRQWRPRRRACSTSSAIRASRASSATRSR